jgi:hypothetical protein
MTAAATVLGIVALALFAAWCAVDDARAAVRRFWRR